MSHRNIILGLSLGLFLSLSLGAAMANAADFQTISKALSSAELNQSISKIRLRDRYRFDSIKASADLQSSNKREYEVRLMSDHVPSDVHDVMPDLCLTVLINEGPGAETGALELVDSKNRVTRWLECQ